VAGAVVAYVLTGGPWALAGAAAGAVTGSFAPSVYDAIRQRGAEHEALREAFERSPPESWARLLDPRRELVRFIGRDDELAVLVAWCEDDRGDRLRLVTGPGGVGKTRLSVELCRRMKELGWRAERVADGQELAAIAAVRAVTRSRVLLVVDYAETRVGLRQMLTALAGVQGEGVRVLLLARSAGDWWDQLGAGEPAVWDLVQAARSAPLALSPVVAADLPDADVIALAVAAFARELGLPERKVEVYGDSGAGQRRMLDLQAAALVAVLADAAAGVVQVDIRTVLAELLRHEQHFWYDSARAYGLSDGRDGTTALVLKQIAAAACLLGAANREEARVLPGRVPGMLPSVKVADWLRILYPPDPDEMAWIGSMQPDRLAELHTLRELTASPELAHACLTNLDSRQGLRAVALLARAASDYPEAEILLSGALPEVAGLIADMRAPAETLATIFNAIPYPTVVLSPAAVTLGQRITGELPGATEPAVRAYWLSSLGIRLCELGRAAEALPVLREAVAIRRELAAAGQGRHRADLAKSLLNLDVTLSELGRPAEALPVIEEAVAIRRELAAAGPDRYLPDLADSLANLGVRLSVLGRLAEALTAEREAVAIRRELAAVSPDRSPDLAGSLANLGVTLSDLGQSEEALPVTEEAIAIRRELAAAYPDRYRRDLASSLGNLGVTLSDLGHAEDALSATEEAIVILRKLAATIPDRYRPDLATSLNNLGATLYELGRSDDAVLAAGESLAIRRGLAAASPGRYLLDVAASLGNLGAMLLGLGRPAEGLTAQQEAVSIYRQLAAASPDLYQHRLASALDSLAGHLSVLGRETEADAARDESATLQTGPERSSRLS
jgi:tetratricopeptide (TPR) repeat protein